MEFKDHPVKYSYELLDEITGHTDVIIDDELLAKIINKLSYSSFTTRGTSSDHLKSVKKNIEHKENKIEQGFCPRCGGKLVYRKGKYGDFWGCSNYPKCRFTMKAYEDNYLE